MTTSSAPTLLQHNGKNVHFLAETGIVDKVSKRVETSIKASASGGGAHQYGSTVVSRPTTLNVSSSNTTVTELWIRSGEREVEHTLRTDLSVRETQKVSIVMVAAEGNRSRHYMGIVNHNTGTWQSLNSMEHLVHNTLMAKTGVGLYFILIVLAIAVGVGMQSFIPTVVLVGGIIYLAVVQSNKMSSAQKAFSSHALAVKEWILVNGNG